MAAVEKNGLGTTWTGTLRGVENGTFFIVVVDGALIAHIASPEGV